MMIFIKTKQIASFYYQFVDIIILNQNPNSKYFLKYLAKDQIFYTTYKEDYFSDRMFIQPNCAYIVSA